MCLRFCRRRHDQRRIGFYDFYAYKQLEPRTATEQKDRHKGQEHVFNFGCVETETSKLRCQEAAVYTGLEYNFLNSLCETGSLITSPKEGTITWLRPSTLTTTRN